MPREEGGGTSYICQTGMCHFSGYHFNLSFERGIKESNFSGAGSQNMSKGNFVGSDFLLVQFLRFGEYF